MKHTVMCKQIVLPLHTPLTPGVGSSFLKVVILQFKLKVMKHGTPCKQIVCPFTRPRTVDGFKRSKHFFIEGHVAYQITRGDCK